MLLPGTDGSAGLLTDIALAPASVSGLGVGLFLGDPFLNIGQLTQDLLALGVAWLANLPGMAQHEPGFRGDMRAVGFSVETELERLADARHAGMRTLAVVSSPDHAAALAKHRADAVLVVPTTADLQISFPSLTRREAMVAAVRAALKDAATQPPVLPLLTSDELLRAKAAALARPVPFVQPASP